MLEWLAQYWLNVLFTAIVGIVGVTGRFIVNTLKKDYIDVVKKNQEDLKETNLQIINLQANIDKKFETINKKIDNMQEQSNSSDLAIIRDTLLRKMRHGLVEQHCVTLADFETVNSLFENYEKLGGNGTVHSLYEKYMQLEICQEEHITNCFGCNDKEGEKIEN